MLGWPRPCIPGTTDKRAVERVFPPLSAASQVTENEISRLERLFGELWIQSSTRLDPAAVSLFLQHCESCHIPPTWPLLIRPRSIIHTGDSDGTS